MLLKIKLGSVLHICGYTILIATYTLLSEGDVVTQVELETEIGTGSGNSSRWSDIVLNIYTPGYQ